MENYKSQKQIQNEKDELIKELKKSNSEMLEMLQKLIVTFSGEDLQLYQITRLQETEQLIQKATTI